MYSQDKINIALQVYNQCGSATKTIRVLGYPTRRALYTWIENEGIPKSSRKDLVIINTTQHPRNPPIEVKMNALYRCFQLGESIKSVSEEMGYTRASIYAWRKKYLRGGTIALMNDKNIQPDIDLLKETISVLKTIRKPFSNRKTSTTAFERRLQNYFMKTRFLRIRQNLWSTEANGKKNIRFCIRTEVVIIGGQAGSSERSMQDLSAPCQRKGVLLIILPVKSCLAA